MLGFFVFRLVALAFQKQREEEFQSIDPEPRFDVPAPQFDQIEHFPDDHDDGSFLLNKRNYRDAILCRDNYTCQSCGKYKNQQDLEVHHVIPRSEGGKDAPTNLVTLCKHCHDREDWYGHVRIYPTTIDQTKQTSHLTPSLRALLRRAGIKPWED
jgi:hypothetical protein